eukprot:GHVR01169287.1.p1 GENE.GHVR01169287.1~~GHVR01169287.1.p1  ORF type:complete len:266 (+),score=56.48 GHVR01169287.1:26-823(+)
MMSCFDFIDNDGYFDIYSKKGHKLKCNLKLNSPSVKEVVILCHGYLSDMTSGLITTIAENIPYNTVRFDFHGCGASEGLDDWSYGGYMDEVEDDLRAVVEFLRTKDLFVKCILGHSRGGNNVLLHAVRFDDVPDIINLAGRFYMKTGVEERFGSQLDHLKPGGVGYITINSGGVTRTITENCLNKRLNLDMSCVRDIKNTKRVLTIHGKRDEIVPVGDAEAFMDEIPSDKHDVILLKDATHMFATKEEQTLVISTIVNFLQSNSK